MNLLNLQSLTQLLFTLTLVCLCFVATPTLAATPNIDLNGYAWSSNIGWISLNCKTGSVTGGDICASSNYKVNVNTTNGLVTGFAWSSNIGWIKFAGLSSYPSSVAPYGSIAKVTGTYPNYSFEGWARACAGTINGDCSSMTSRTGGWDGWISLKGTNYGISVSSSGFANNSYAWGDVVVGWIDMFSHTSWLLPSATITGNSCTVSPGQNTCNTSVSWNITNATTPIVKNGPTQISTTPVSNSNITLTLNTDTIIYAYDDTIELTSLLLSPVCASPLIVAPDGKCQYQGPDITISTDKSIIRSGDKIHVSWTISPTPLISGVVCKLTGPGMPAGNQTASGESDSSSLTSKSKFTIYCDGPFGHEEKTTSVQVVPKTQEV